MKPQPQPTFIGSAVYKEPERTVSGEYVRLLGEDYYKIQNFDAIEPFFMSIVSSSDHWLFIASTGGITAGRGSVEKSLFPYYTVDKITENSENTGNKAILRVNRSQRVSLWEPFSERGRGNYSIERNLYKNVAGTALIFEENNFDLDLTYRYAWRTSEKFGFVKTTWLRNTAASSCEVSILDGIQNILPANVAMATQLSYSSLLDAYKRSELHAQTGLGIFNLNSTLTDLAEPSESLLATIVVQVGLPAAGYLLASTQLDCFRSDGLIVSETEVRGRRGAYMTHAVLELKPQEERTWHLVADVQQDHAAIAIKNLWLQQDPATLIQELEDDIAAGQHSLWKIVTSADGVQITQKPLISAHHFANVMFNVMRGGIFPDQYWIRSGDFTDFIAVRNKALLQSQADFFSALPARIHLSDLQTRAKATASPDLLRLSYSYLPLTFSRRHGDPSRPWNRFIINVKKPDGSLKIDYQGNWRDIFQNWEALAYSYPEFVENMFSTFLNATTADGYNPYRITNQGVDWEIPEPGNPWANIGYWSDHQIIYLVKLLEISDRVHPGKLTAFLPRRAFSYADVPYRIKPYADLLKDSYNTIDFEWNLERKIDIRQGERGTDGKLVMDQHGQVLQVSLVEKLLTLLLAKLSNFVPEGGIWMNTQRPEWNDANNALVGKGLSVVTLGYLRRYLAFCTALLHRWEPIHIQLTAEVARFYNRIYETLRQFQPVLEGRFTDEQRRAMMDDLGEAGSCYRWGFYQNGFSGEQVDAQVGDIIAFFELAQQYVEHSLRANRRSDALYNSYNILHLDSGRASVSYLYEMLEGQVAILSSGLLSAEESLALLQSMSRSALYQSQQHSYILYPERPVPGFLEKNRLNQRQVDEISLLQKLLETQDTSIVTRDIHGMYHFNGQFRNFKDVRRALDALRNDPDYSPWIDADIEKIEALFEDTFHHDEFTGRSGTFFAYEGLGSVYWHMVTKLLLAVQETAMRFKEDENAPALAEKYRDIRQGLGFNKSPDVYGAFPTDPYSHTPKGQGAKQPGMTGSVKEEILTRQAELGFLIEEGRIVFDALLLDSQEFLDAPSLFSYTDVDGNPQEIGLEAGCLAYLICQTPVILREDQERSITVHFADGADQRIEGAVLDVENSRHIFLRNGVIRLLSVSMIVEALGE